MHLHVTDKYGTTLLRTSRRDGKRVRKNTIANLTSWPKSQISKLQAALAMRRRTAGTILEEDATLWINDIISEQGWSTSDPSAQWQLLCALDRRGANKKG